VTLCHLIHNRHRFSPIFHVTPTPPFQEKKLRQHTARFGWARWPLLLAGPGGPFFQSAGKLRLLPEFSTILLVVVRSIGCRAPSLTRETSCVIELGTWDSETMRLFAFTQNLKRYPRMDIVSPRKHQDPRTFGWRCGVAWPVVGRWWLPCRGC